MLKGDTELAACEMSTQAKDLYQIHDSAELRTPQPGIDIR